MEDNNTENNTGLSGVKFNDTDSSSDKVKRAYDLYEAGRFQEALTLGEQNSMVAGSSYGQVLIGNCYNKLGDQQSAMAHWKKAIEISPLEHNAYMNIANLQYSSGKINEAISNWTIASTIVPENATVNLNLALAYDKKGSRIKSTRYFEKFIKYEKKISTPEYITIKNKFANLTAKVDFYAKKVEEFKLQKDLKTIAALYLKMISTYSLLPSIYCNIADIFYFDRNFEKALEFYQIVYLYFPYTTKVLLEIANLCFMMNHKSYAYVYYHRALQSLPEGTSYYIKVSGQLKTLSPILNEPELIETHLQRAREAAENNDYELAIDEYENYLILTESDNPDIQQTIDKYKIFVNPEPFVINVLYTQIPELMNKKKLNSCVDLCDRIITMAKDHSKEVVYAMKCKSECKRIIIAREQFGV